ncbi:MAG TPA: DNA primase [Bryobacteraceae bacterium]|nr:DNA primase [Bryobacteraceae bacterium]
MDFARQLKSQIDIVAVIGERVPLKKRGTFSYVGLCPFHQEKSGSFNVHQEKQFFKCFGCGASGDVIKFVMDYESVTFLEAITSLSERYGIPMPQRAPADDPESRLRAALLEMHELAARHFQQNLESPAGAEARSYLARRGVTAALAAEFRLGFSERGGALARLLQKQGFPLQALEASSLVKRRDDGSWYDSFRGRLMFPIANESGKVIAFGGRAMQAGEEPKYLNSAGTAIYHKSGVLYSIHRARDGARKSGRVVLVEGYMDVIGAYSAGVPEAVAPCGTALTAPQVRALRRLAPLAIVNFDPDAAGANATEKSIQLLLDENFRVRIAALEGGLDPDEYVKNNGPDAYRDRIAAALPYFHWLAGRARQRFDVRTSEGKVQALEFLLPHVRQVSDRVERAALANEMAAVLGVEQGLLLEQFRRAAGNRAGEHIEMPAVDVPPSEKLLLELFLHSDDVRQSVFTQLSNYPQLLDSAAREIWSGILAFPDAGSFHWEELDAKLSPPSRSLMAAMAFADHLRTEQNMVEQAVACLAQLGAGNRKQRISELKQRVRGAEQRGAIMEALELAEELNRLEREV